MKKIINNPKDCVEEFLEGYVAAYGDQVKAVEGVHGIVTRNKKEGKVSIVVGGGSGHEPFFLGFVGENMADGCAVGNVFAAPDPNTVLEVTKACDGGAGVLYLYGSYSGDNLNFGMAQEFAQDEGIDVRIVTTVDDVVSADLEHQEDRRGIAGSLFAFKVVGAAAAKGYNLDQVEAVAKKARENIRSAGIALGPCSLPGEKPIFELGEDEMEFGMGIHGERGIKREKLKNCDAIVDEMMDRIIADLPFKAGDEVCVYVNGLGSTTVMELGIMTRRVLQICEEKGIKVYDSFFNSYCTSFEMAGASVSLFKLDDELKELYDMKARTPFYTKD